ncbi:uncharacterized protein [Physcomitrium patens]|uniref:Aminotransferase class I/classII large domain-containing protein n=2 Tax=Physcomitrium patens TaxID=3218 RepID=A9RKL4_PHYPA|nr:uncharacterized protein LOC112283628 isoform X2 [Physcomitrium patens]PNR52890.1 hypothetical protein PHYPA_009265 [Physcomitrium patens]|eukprot:XP_024378374.1 uncharacterized protein LOC112283628 isoform X2 [Physcomitrella patens]
MAERTLLARRTTAFAPSPIQQLSLLAQRCNAINLAEGFPDFPAPPEIKEAAIAAIRSDFNQYRHVQGVCEKVAEAFEMSHGVRVDAATQITICCGQSEAMAATVFAVVEEGDEVVLLDPVYETYQSCIILAGGTPRYVSLNPPHWSLDFENLESAFGSKTKAIIINSPHNPTGKAFSTSELAKIATLCCKYDCLAITDEVYEHIIFDGREHVSIASFPGMQQRTIVTSSLSKTFSVTGWRIGWAVAPATISAAIGNIHVKMTDSAPAPFQEAALVALQSTTNFFTQLKQEYEERRDYVCEMLLQAGFSNFLKPEGSFFVFAELPKACPLNDVDYVAELIQGAGVAVVPGRGFFHQAADTVGQSTQFKDQSNTGEELSAEEVYDSNGATKFGELCIQNYTTRYIRVAFCKDMATLRAAKTAIQKHLALVDPDTGHKQHYSSQCSLDRPHFFT